MSLKLLSVHWNKKLTNFVRRAVGEEISLWVVLKVTLLPQRHRHLQSMLICQFQNFLVYRIWKIMVSLLAIYWQEKPVININGQNVMLLTESVRCWRPICNQHLQIVTYLLNRVQRTNLKPHLGCPCESFLAIKTGRAQQSGSFFRADRTAYSWQHIKNLELAGVSSAIKFWHCRVLWKFLK